MATGTAAAANSNATHTAQRATTHIRISSAPTSELTAATDPWARATAPGSARYACSSQHAAAADTKPESLCCHSATGSSTTTTASAARRTRWYCVSGAAVPAKHPDVAYLHAQILHAASHKMRRYSSHRWETN